LAQICTKSFSGWGFPQTPLGSSQRSTDPLAGKVGRDKRGRGGEGKGEKRKEGEGKEGRGD